MRDMLQQQRNNSAKLKQIGAAISIFALGWFARGGFQQKQVVVPKIKPKQVTFTEIVNISGSGRNSSTNLTRIPAISNNQSLTDTRVPANSNESNSNSPTSSSTTHPSNSGTTHPSNGINKETDDHDPNYIAQAAKIALQKMEEMGATPFAPVASSNNLDAYDYEHPYGNFSVNLVKENFFRLAFSNENDEMSWNSVMKRVFPQTWGSCALHKLARNQDHGDDGILLDVKISILGGSITAFGSTSELCSRNDTTTSTRAEGSTTEEEPVNMNRFSDKVYQGLNHHMRPKARFEVQNMGQGGTTTVGNGLVLDQLLYRPDLKKQVLVWEFYRNDGVGGYGSKPDEYTRRLDYWLRRVYAHFCSSPPLNNSGNVTQEETTCTPPPVILLCSIGAGQRDFEAYRQSTTPKNPPEDSNPLSLISGLLTAYQSAGWEIGVINVGAVINATRLVQMNWDLVRDENGRQRHGTSLGWPLTRDDVHTTCLGAELMGDLIQYFFFSNMASCEAPIPKKTDSGHVLERRNVQPPANPLKRVYGDDRLKPFEELWTDLFQVTTRIGSVSPWVPKLLPDGAGIEATRDSMMAHPLSTSNFQWFGKQQSWEVGGAEKAAANRQDRKFTFVVPACSKSSLLLPLKEPNLKWLGVGYGGARADVLPSFLEIKVNNTTRNYNITHNGMWYTTRPKQLIICSWVNLQHLIQPSERESPFSISLCSSGERRQLPKIFAAVGVMVQP